MARKFRGSSAFRYDNYVKVVYKCQKETIERIFADAKEKHGMRFIHLRGLAKIKFEVTLIFLMDKFKEISNKAVEKKKLFFDFEVFKLLLQKISTIFKFYRFFNKIKGVFKSEKVLCLQDERIILNYPFFL